MPMRSRIAPARNTLAITLGLVDRARAVHVATVPIILPT
jgi:hypothetical protein